MPAKGRAVPAAHPAISFVTSSYVGVCSVKLVQFTSPSGGRGILFPVMVALARKCLSKGRGFLCLSCSFLRSAGLIHLRCSHLERWS